MTNVLDTHTLIQLFAQRCELLMQLRQLVGRQLELIDSSDLSQLLSLLAVKQRSIGKLQTIQRQLEPYRGQLPQSALGTAKTTVAVARNWPMLASGCWQKSWKLKSKAKTV